MLSRLAFRNVQSLPIMACGAQVMSTAASNRPKRLIEPSPVRYGFIPEEWFTFFYPKTGVTGPYMFGIGLSTYLVSKEIYVLEHEYYTGLTFLLIWIIGVKKFGSGLAAHLDKEIDTYEQSWQISRDEEIKQLQDNIEAEKKEQWRTEAQALIMEAKKENIKMQLEAEYRSRVSNVYNEVKKRLDYQAQKHNVERQFAHKHMVQWIVDSVKAALTPDLEKTTLQQCIKDLQALAPRA